MIQPTHKPEVTRCCLSGIEAAALNSLACVLICRKFLAHNVPDVAQVIA